MAAGRHRWRTAAGLIVASLATAIAVVGCSASKNAGGSGDTVAQPARGDAASSEKDPGAAGPPLALPSGAPIGTAGPDGGSNQAPQVEPQQRSVIYTGTMSVRVDDVNDAADRAISLATGLGGFVGADRRSLDDKRSEAEITLRVPADKFDQALAELAKLGKEESRAVQTQDVTEVVVDLDARLVSQQASVDRVRALLAKAQTIGEVVSVESELARREADLASLQARKRSLTDKVDLSTIAVSLLGPAAPAPTPDEPQTGFLAGLKSGWKAFLASIQIVLTVLGALIPWIVAVGVPVWLVVWLVRRRGRRPAPAAATSVAPTYGLPPAPPASDT
jgi:Domain of unknown function (DUF4349)